MPFSSREKYRAYQREYYRRFLAHPRPSAIERFHTKYRIDAESGCWVWTRGLTSAGYASFFTTAAGNSILGYRWIYEQMVGPVPHGLELDHLCRNRACVNPAHLEAVTRRENVMRGVAPSAQNARKTACKRGHLFTEESTYRGEIRHGRPTRRCRICNKEAVMKYQSRIARRSLNAKDF